MQPERRIKMVVLNVHYFTKPGKRAEFYEAVNKLEVPRKSKQKKATSSMTTTCPSTTKTRYFWWRTGRMKPLSSSIQSRLISRHWENSRQSMLRRQFSRDTKDR